MNRKKRTEVSRFNVKVTHISTPDAQLRLRHAFDLLLQSLQKQPNQGEKGDRAQTVKRTDKETAFESQ